MSTTVPFWIETKCATRTYQAARDIGTIKEGECVTQFCDSGEFWVTAGLGREKIRMVTLKDFEDVRQAFFERAKSK